MKLGVTLPAFTADAGAVLEAARAAERAGLHGVFCFDHQFPLGHPERPSMSIYPVLGAVAAVTERIRIGSLVARIGLLPDEVVAASLESLASMAGDRLVAGLGTGDEESEPEHFAFGLPYLGVATREERLAKVVARLRSNRIECWVGAGKKVTNDTAEGAGAAINFWGATPERIARAVSRRSVPITWGGPLPGTLAEAGDLLRGLVEAGATWAVWAWPPSIELVSAAAAAAGVPLGDAPRLA